MNRLQTYREYRKNRRIFTGLVSMFLILLLAGIFLTDYSTNSLRRDRGGIGIISVQSDPESVKIGIFNRTLYLNTSYMKRDMEKVRQFVFSLLDRQPD